MDRVQAWNEVGTDDERHFGEDDGGDVEAADEVRPCALDLQRVAGCHGFAGEWQQ